MTNPTQTVKAPSPNHANVIGKCSICSGAVLVSGADCQRSCSIPQCISCGAFAKESMPTIAMEHVRPSETVEIPIRGGVALVDAADLPLVSGRKWRAKKIDHNTYAYCWLGHAEGSRDAAMHRLLLGFPKGYVDHRDGNGLNNSRANIRVATASENARNSRLPRGCGFRGVGFHKPSGVWRVTCGRKTISEHKEPLEAALAYDKVAREMYGEFARLNFPGVK